MTTGDHPANAKRGTTRRWALLAFRLGLIVVIYLTIFRNVSAMQIVPLLTPAFGWALAGGVALNVFQAATCTVRWQLLAKSVPARPGFLPSFSAYLEGLFFNQALPSFIGGDALRVVRWRGFGVTLHGAFVSVLRDRLFGAIGAALLAIPACLILWTTAIPGMTTLGALALSFAALAAGAGVLLLIQSRRVTAWLARFKRLHGILHRISDRPLGPEVYAVSTFLSLLGQVLSGVTVLLVARSVGIQLPAALLVLVTGIVLVVSMAPISFAGWGVREASFLTLLTPLGAAPEAVMLLGISMGLVGLLGALPGAFSLLMGWSKPKQERADKMPARSS